VFATHRTVDNYSTRSFGDPPRYPDRNSAIDDRQIGPELFNVPGSLTDKIPDPERVTDMQNVDLLNPFGQRGNVYSERLHLSGNELENGSPYLSEPRDYSLLGFSHANLLAKIPA